MEEACKECGSRRLLRSTRLLAFGGILGPYTVGLQGPMASVKGNVRAEVVASVCVDCGSVRLRALGLDELQKTYAALGGDPALKLNL